MTIVLHRTNKRENSLLIPSGAGVSKTVVLKEKTSLTSPVFVLNYMNVNPTQYNYCYCSEFLRYYFIRDWVFDGRMWEAHCEVDVLASFKEQIKSSSYYVLRSTSDYDPKIIDTFYPAKSEIHNATSSDIDLHFSNPLNPDAGRFVLGSITRCPNANSPSGITYYVVDKNALNTIRNNLYPDLTTSLNDLEKIMDIPAIVLSNPSQYIASLMWFPFTPDCTFYTGLDLCLGYYRVWHGDGVGVVNTLTHEIHFAVTPNRPSTTRGDWQKLEPFCRYYLYLPFFGIINLPSAIAAYQEIWGDISVSLVTGAATLKVGARNPDTLEIMTIAVRSAQIGQPFALTGISENWGGLAQGNVDMLGGIANMALGKPIEGTMQAMGGAIQTACSIFTKSADVFGTAGGTSETGYLGYIVTEWFDPAEEDNNNFGRPLCSQRSLSGLSGYCKVADGLDAKTSATPIEKEKIKRHLEGGFYIE